MRSLLPLSMMALMAALSGQDCAVPIASGPIDVGLAEALLLHDWPLNVRGLLNVLSIAVIASD
ncbi:hypothetical protein HRD49_26370, partial [Corallococcus exiguus]|uniref:hypothetical protein n=1 Tax=Corallococcus exiguus TaxID=83462 RepID=UPI001EC70B79